MAANNRAVAYAATLEHGDTFILFKSGKTFERGRPKLVTSEERIYLESNAVDVHDCGDLDENDAPVYRTRQKFSFKEEGAVQ